MFLLLYLVLGIVGLGALGLGIFCVITVPGEDCG